MATVNANRATNTLGSPAFLKSAVLIVVGSLLAQVVDFVRFTDYSGSSPTDLPHSNPWNSSKRAGLAPLG